MGDTPQTITSERHSIQLQSRLVALATVQADLGRVLAWLDNYWTPDLPLPYIGDDFDSQTDMVLAIQCRDTDTLERVKAVLGDAATIVDQILTYRDKGRYRYVTRRWGSVTIEAWQVLR